MIETGLLVSAIGAFLLLISTQFGQVTGFVGGMVWADLWWRLANAAGWLLLVVGFGLQFAGAHRTRRFSASSASPARDDGSRRRVEALLTVLGRIS